MWDNLQLFGVLVLLLVASILASQQVRRVFRQTDHVKLARQQLRDAQRQYLLHRAQGEHNQAMADMYSEQADRLKGYLAPYPEPMTVKLKWQGPTFGDMLKSHVHTSVEPLAVFTGAVDDSHAELRKTWAPGQVWEVQSERVGAWYSLGKVEPQWHAVNAYRRAPAHD